jgi:hypothetical protein
MPDQGEEERGEKKNWEETFKFIIWIQRKVRVSELRMLHVRFRKKT